MSRGCASGIGNSRPGVCSFGNHEAFLAQIPKDFYHLAEIACTRKVWMKQAPGPRTLEREGCTVESLVQTQQLLNWQTHKVAEGQKGPIVAAFARVRGYLSAERTAESERWLVRRNDADGQIKYALSNAAQKLARLAWVRVSQARWPMERCVEEDKSELGLDPCEHRSWPAWHRHTRLVFLAQLFLVRLRRQYKKTPALSLPQARQLIEWSLPDPKREVEYVLKFVRYHQVRNYQACQSLNLEL